MANTRLFDNLQAYRFWLFDITPSPKFPFFVLGGGVFGFSAMTTPEITANVEPIKSYNSLYTSNQYTDAEVGQVTLSRGATFYDNTMWTWLNRSIQGLDVPYRDLIMVQMINQEVTGGINVSNVPVGYIPGRVWVLRDCIPVRYKAGTDFEATSGEVSIMELDIKPRKFMEVTVSELVSG